MTDKPHTHDYKTLMDRAEREFDFKRWRAWLQAKAVELQRDTIKTQFGCGPDDGPKPGMGFGIIGTNAMGNFENWVTGETDYTIMVIPSPKLNMVSHKWGLIVNDESFERTFEEFITEFRKYDVPH